MFPINFIRNNFRDEMSEETKEYIKIALESQDIVENSVVKVEIEDETQILH